MSAAEEFAKLVDIMKTLREDCPWDRQQDHGTLRQYLLEETYEVLEALDEGDTAALQAELGDLLLQVVFQSEVAEEGGEFAIEDVIRAINRKLVRRHPHVFSDGEARTPDDVVDRWEKIKTGSEAAGSRLAGVPRRLPALLRAVRVMEKMRRAGLDPFDGRDPAGLARESLEKLGEETDGPDSAGTERTAAAALLACAGLCRRLGLNPEDVLRARVSRMVRAFQALEQRLQAEGCELEDLSVEERRRLSERFLTGDTESEGG